MKIYFGSDIHMEFGRGTLKVPTDGDVLLLAGDIFLPWVVSARLDQMGSEGKNHRLKVAKRQEKFLSECSAKFKQVFMIPGNHEFYHGEFYKTQDRIQMILDRLGCNNIHMLHEESVVFGDYALFGSTFWTDMRNSDPMVVLSVAGSMNDYCLVRDEVGHVIHPNLTVAENKYARGELVKFFETLPEGKQPIVMTHMAPFFMSVPDRYKLDEDSFAYANTKIEYLLDPYELPPTFWIHGHTHDKLTYSFGNIQVLCNPRGYWGVEGSSREFEFLELPEKVFVEKTAE